MQVLKLRKAFKNNGGDYWYSVPGCIRYTQEQLYHELRAGTQLEFDGNQDLALLGLLSFAEKGSSGTPIKRETKGDVAFLNRIIRAGGFVESALLLENCLMSKQGN